MVDQINSGRFREAIEAFYFAYREFTTQPDRILTNRGLNRVHHRILYFVGENRNIAVTKLLKILSVSKQALNAPLRQLIEMKLIVSVVASHDGRVKCLALTDTGENLEQQLTLSQIQLLESAFKSQSNQSIDQWVQVMHRIAKIDS